jgi:hypothetical protein
MARWAHCAADRAAMSAPARSPVVGRTTRPSDSDLERALGRAKLRWDQLVAELASEHDVTTREWKSYAARSGWSLRLLRGKRTIVWLVPYAGCFQVAFIFGDKALTAIRQSAVPARVLRMLEEAPRYPEGTGLRFDVKAVKDIAVVKTLAAIKLEH